MDAAIRAKVTLTNPIHFLALGFGSGLAPKAPGTFGTLAALPLVVLLSLSTPFWLYIVLAVLGSVVGIWICGKAASDMGVHDDSSIVWDEVIGMMITMCAVPMSWQNIVVGFILFRLFDIAKPWPISYLDKNLHGGLGIMLDDVVAGLAALACMQFIIYQGWL
jgi:phosphatidylglycerophosphatase A